MQIEETNDQVRERLYNKTLKEYLYVSDELKKLAVETREWFEYASKEDPYDYYNNKEWKETFLMKTYIRQARLCSELYNLSLSIEDKIWLWENDRDMLPPYDGLGKDEYCGKLIPTELEISIGMYKERALYEFVPYTCGVYAFYTPDLKKIFIGSSQYIEKYIHSMANRMTKPYHDKTRFRNLYNIMFTPGVRFRILDTCPYSLLPYAEYKYKEKYIYSNENVYGKLKGKEKRKYDRIRNK